MLEKYDTLNMCDLILRFQNWVKHCGVTRCTYLPYSLDTAATLAGSGFMVFNSFNCVQQYQMKSDIYEAP
jgi:hypothetical protein